MNKVLCGVLVCLLFVAGCSATGGSSRGRIGSWRLLPTRLGSRRSEDSLIKAVEKDPFPRAGQADRRA